MAEWLVLLLLVPAVVLPVVYLFGFAGCGFEGHGEPIPPLVLKTPSAPNPVTVNLSWTGGTVDDIQFQRDKTPNAGEQPESYQFIVQRDPLSATDTDGLSGGHHYDYKAREVFGDGQFGDWTNPVGVNTPAVATPTSVTFDAAGTGHTDSGFGSASVTWSHTATGNAGAVVVGVRWSQTGGLGDPTRTVTYGAGAMQSLGVRGLNGEPLNAIAAVFVEFFGLRNPPTTPQTVSVSVDRGGSSLNLEACSVSYANVSNFVAAPPVSGTEAGTAMTQPVTSAANEMVAQMFGTASGTITGYSQTTRYNSPNSLLIGDAPGAAAISFTATRASGVDYAGVAVRLTPVT